MKTPHQHTTRIVGAIIGTLLIAAAVTALLTRGESAQSALQSMGEAPVWLFLALGATVAITPLLTAANFLILTRRYGHVTSQEMTALILAAWLLNYLPLWPGMVSRVAYHRVVNRIPVRASARVIVEAGVLSGLAAGVLAALLLGIARPLGLGGWSGVAVGMSGAGLSVVIAMLIAHSARRPHAWRYFAVLSIRTIELGVWGLRYAIGATIVGAEISPSGALTIAALVQIAVLAPIAPNGLGVREWAVGISASVFAIGISAEAGLAIGLLDRGMEVLVAVPLGLVAGAWLARKRRQLRLSGDMDRA